MVPNEASLADLARAIGVTERRVATVKAEGRLPLTGAGKANIAALLKLGWNASLESRPRGPRANSEPPERAFDAGMRVAASVAAHCVLSAILAPLPGEDAETAAARGLNLAMDILAVPLDPEVRQPDRLSPLPLEAMA